MHNIEFPLTRVAIHHYVIKHASLIRSSKILNNRPNL